MQDRIGGRVRLEQLTLRTTGDEFRGDSLPVVVDEALVRLHGDAKWELLDVLERMAAETQLVYLSDDPYVGAWARRRAATGAITLLEPVAEGV